MKVVLLVLRRGRRRARERVGRMEGRVAREDRGRVREARVMRMRVRRGRRVSAVMRRRRQSGGGGRWVGGCFSFSSLLC